MVNPNHAPSMTFKKVDFLVDGLESIIDPNVAIASAMTNHVTNALDFRTKNDVLLFNFSN